MYQQIVQIKSLAEIETVFFKQSDDYYFIDEEIKSVENKNTIKSLGARYLIKKTILDFLKLDEEFNDIEIGNEDSGKPVVKYSGKVEEQVKQQNIRNIQASISHSRNFIATLIVIE